MVVRRKNKMEDVEKLRLNFHPLFKITQVADMARKAKVCWCINPDIEQKGNDYIKANDQNHTDLISMISTSRPT